jgi:hypothetical protein
MTAGTGPVDLDAVERDANDRIDELRQRRQPLALDALSDRKVRTELDKVETELAGAEAQLGRVELARAEQGRREAERQRQELDERQAAALEQARRQQGERQAAAVRIDREASNLMEAISCYVGACSEQQRWFTEAGLSQAASAAQPRAWLVEGALIHAKRQVRLSVDVMDLPAIASENIGPIAERDLNLIDAYASKG